MGGVLSIGGSEKIDKPVCPLQKGEVERMHLVMGSVTQSPPLEGQERRSSRGRIGGLAGKNGRGNCSEAKKSSYEGV